MPLFEEHEARLERNIDVETWMSMDEREKALIVAARRIHIAIQNLQEEAQIKHAEKNVKRRK